MNQPSQPIVKSVDSALHNYEGDRSKLVLLLLLATTPVGHALALIAAASSAMVWFADRGNPKPSAPAPRPAPEPSRFEGRWHAPPKRPRTREPFMSREDYEAKIREAMSGQPAYDFEGTCVEEPLLALGQHA